MLHKRGKRILSIVALIIVLMFIIGMIVAPLASTKAADLSLLQNIYGSLRM
jgi:conjugal transfer/entry exclusion protein